MSDFQIQIEQEKSIFKWIENYMSAKMTNRIGCVNF